MTYTISAFERRANTSRGLSTRSSASCRLESLALHFMNGREWRCSDSVSVVNLLIGAGVRQWTSQDSKWTAYDSSQSETESGIRGKRRLDAIR